jgi:hypothetical protein
VRVLSIFTGLKDSSFRRSAIEENFLNDFNSILSKSDTYLIGPPRRVCSALCIHLTTTFTMVGLDVLGLLRPAVASLRAGINEPEEEAAVTTESACDKCMYTNLHDTEIHKRSAAHQFVHVHAQSMASVFAMVIGIPEYEGILEQEPFSLEKKKDHTKEFKPTNEQLMKEILRRAYFFEKDFETMDNANGDLSLHPNVNKRGIAKQPEPRLGNQSN